MFEKELSTDERTILTLCLNNYNLDSDTHWVNILDSLGSDENRARHTLLLLVKRRKWIKQKGRGTRNASTG